MKTAIYLRVSTDHQSTDHQRVACENYIAAKHPGVSTTIYEDQAISGANCDRPGLNKLLSDVEEGVISRIVTFEFSRLSRDFLYSLNLMSTLNSKGVSVESPDSGVIKFDSALDQFLVSVKGFVAAQERENIKLRIKSGISKAKAKAEAEGTKYGSTGAPKGNKNGAGNRGKKYSKTKAITADEVRAKRAEGMTYSSIAAAAGVSEMTIYRLVRI